MAAPLCCPRCGVELPTESLAGLCPNCLLQMAVAAPSASAAGEGMSATVDYGQRPADDALALASSQATLVQATLPQPGQQFGGYHIVRQLGRGGMGVVYEADHLASGRRVALKVLAHALDSPETRRRFLREGRLAASVNHPHSVYVYGTEEIDGSPAISMELVSGGTLQSHVKEHGPLPVREAVDAVLQMISGLEAAQAVGVLHRDIKPANCFLDEDGGVKIGDFGLSISTVGRGDSHLTNAGSFLGTPAFSSPEQLRGDELDVRSDIYSVGVTLYYLLTGRTPFEADNMVRLLATVLERPAESPAKFRPEIQRGLARVVLRCLEKQPARRFRNYDELRQALAPFSSSTPLPARLSTRFLAGFVDEFIATMPDGLFFIIVGIDLVDNFTQSRTWQAAAAWLAIRAFAIVYYAVPEGLWGASLGKALWGLRVVGPYRAPPGLRRALVRAAIFTLASQVPYFVQLTYTTAEEYREVVNRGDFTAANWASAALWLLLFSTMRLRNGYAAIHDLASGTRVIQRPKQRGRPTMRAEPEPVFQLEGTPQIGPYHVLDRLGGSAGGEVLVGYDTRLLRKVWIRQLPAGAPPVAGKVRGLSRAGRLRWLTGQRSEAGCWDAYEAVDGRPLASLLDAPQPWGMVRYWLWDLAEELSAGLKDGTLPEVGLENIWITASGRAKLLDFAAPAVALPNPELEPFATGDVTMARRFLSQVALSTLEGQPIAAGRAVERSPKLPLPLSARSFLDELRDPAGKDLPTRELEPLLDRNASVTRTRRLTTLVAAPLAALLITALVVGVMAQAMHRWDQSWTREHPDLPSLRQTMRALDDVDASDKQGKRALKIYLTGHFGPIIRDPAFWEQAEVIAAFPEGSSDRAATALADFPNPTPDELKQADAIATVYIEEAERTQGEFLLLIAVGMLCGTMVIWAGVELMTALVFGEGLMLVIMDLALVNRKGRKASRLRVLWRWLLVWGVFAGALMSLYLLGDLVVTGLVDAWVVLWLRMIAAFTVLTILLGFVWSLAAPRRGLQDYLAGTWLVAR